MSTTIRGISKDRGGGPVNDRSVRTHELVGPETMIDELDTVYRRLVETVRGLPAGEVDEKIAGTIPYYTYLHWEEHFAELGIPL